MDAGGQQRFVIRASWYAVMKLEYGVLFDVWLTDEIIMAIYRQIIEASAEADE